jgi:hypothetical protein
MIIVRRPPEWLPKGTPTWAALILESWTIARADLKERGGADEARWTWARLGEPALFEHPLAAVPEIGSQFAIEPLAPATGGSNDTVNAGASVSMRLVADLADWTVRGRPSPSASPATRRARTGRTSWPTGAPDGRRSSRSRFRAVAQAAVQEEIFLPASSADPPTGGGPR